MVKQYNKLLYEKCGNYVNILQNCVTFSDGIWPKFIFSYKCCRFSYNKAVVCNYESYGEIKQLC